MKLPPPPDLLLAAMLEDNYSKDGADFTTTEILKPPQITFLANNHESRSMPVYKSWMSMLGTGVHKALEDAAPEKAIIEERLFWEFDIKGETVKLGGKPDYIHEGILNDYKVVMTAGLPNGTPKPDHLMQGYFNSWLAIKNGINVDYACVEYMLRDWQPSIAERQANYPQTPNVPLPFPLIPLDSIEKMIVERLTLHVDAKYHGINTPCTDEERWKRPDAWALKKPANKRARKVCHSHGEAVKEQKDGEEIDFRQGGCIRCESWCEYSHVCPQHNDKRTLIT